MFGQIYLEYSTEFSQIPQGSTRFHVLPFPSIPFYGFLWYSMRSGECSGKFREVPGRFHGLLRSSVAFSGVSRALGVRGDDSAAYVTLMRSSLGKPEGIYIVAKYKYYYSPNKLARARESRHSQENRQAAFESDFGFVHPQDTSKGTLSEKPPALQ